MRLWFALILVLGLLGTYYNFKLMSDCMDSGNPRSQACFKYNVFTQNNHNLNLNIGE